MKEIVENGKGSLVANNGKGLSNDHLPTFVRSLNPVVQSLERMAAQIAPTEIPVLLVGEEGTGKALFASLIHQLSSRRKERLVKLRCAGLGADGAFSKPGREQVFGNSHGDAAVGTVLFAEVGDLDVDGQGYLLRALKNGDAGEPQLPASARRIFTTSRNLEEETQAGRFSRDLYSRINCVSFRLPPLRERPEDLPPLVDFFLAKHASQSGRPRPTISAQTLKCLLDYSWPGNIRQLESVIEKIAAVGEGEAIFAELRSPPPGLQPASSPGNGPSLKMAARAASRQAERELILKTLARTRWNRKRAAQELQISYKSLLYKLKHIGLDNSDGNTQGF